MILINKNWMNYMVTFSKKLNMENVIYILYIFVVMSVFIRGILSIINFNGKANLINKDIGRLGTGRIAVIGNVESILNLYDRITDSGSESTGSHSESNDEEKDKKDEGKNKKNSLPSEARPIVMKMKVKITQITKIKIIELI
uniref:Uncharacterized protein n=1 Tax=Amanita inopinata TaxID=933333 RepID=A0A5Q0N4A6_9AGAR|nr:hypothetical protein [Amanita inopinata]QFZ98607.1 hypothetical protein [Amanita inopinata]